MSLDDSLTKMARTLRALDEASLMQLWERYAARAAEFEPTAKWEESVLVLGMIQAVRFKNQLFNHNFAQNAGPNAGQNAGQSSAGDAAQGPNNPDQAHVDELPKDATTKKPEGKVLAFPGAKKDHDVNSTD